LAATQVDNHFEVIPHRARGYIRLTSDENEKLPESALTTMKPDKLYNAPLHDTSVKIPGGGMVSTAPDLVRFATAINRGKLLRAETLKAMWEPQLLKSKNGAEYGLGWRVLQHDGAKVVGHSGGQSGVATLFLLCPEKHIAAAVMCNLQGAKLQPLCLQLLDQICGIEAKPKAAARSPL
jgi:CubicO group peptidase (beta-lactamase class C family)